MADFILIVLFLFCCTIVCIKPSEGTPWESKSLNDCGRTYAKLTERTGKILSGEDALPEEFPWMVSIKSLKGGPTGQHVCGGFVINSRHIISAAHCFKKKYNRYLEYYEDGTVVPSSVKIAIGQYDLTSNEKTKIVQIEYLAIHPNFESGGHLNHDIAILRTSEEMRWDQNLHPICLPDVEINEYFETKVFNVSVAGWGNTHCQNVSPSKMLKKVTVPIWKNGDCLQAYKDAHYDFTREGYVCAGDFDKDSSKGDSGSPLMMLQDNRWTAIGIVSAGRFMCEDRVPGVYTKISSYLNWIHSEII